MPALSSPSTPLSATDMLAALPPRKTVSVGNATISYRTAGEGPALVFLHGLLGSADSWACQLTSLADHCRVIAWDAPGYMDSSAAPQDIDAFARRLADFIAALGLSAPTVIGHSMGGTVAARLASMPSSPIGTLVLSCTHAGYAAPAGTPPTQKLLDRMQTLHDQGGAAYGRSRAGAMVAHPVTPFALELAALVAADTRPEGLFDATRMLQFANLRPHYAAITAPTLVLFGGSDPVVRPEMSQELHTLTPFAHHEELPGVGHAPYLENPTAYNAALARFLGPSRLPSPPAA